VADSIVIEGRFNGPPQSAHGGYACGLLARHIDPNLAEVTLRSPPPLDTELQLRAGGDSPAVRLFDGDILIAAGREIEALELEIPDPVSLEQAEAAREGSPLQQTSPYASCFVCGPERHPPQGLRVIAGPVEGRDDVIASPWQVDQDLPLEDGSVAPEIVWAALDCPSGCALMLRPEIGVAMLARMSAQLLAPVEPGATYVALGWPFNHDRRKHLSATAIFTAGGELVATAKGLWIELRDQP
jgi:hypothetical protein